MSFELHNRLSLNFNTVQLSDLWWIKGCVSVHVINGCGYVHVVKGYACGQWAWHVGPCGNKARCRLGSELI